MMENNKTENNPMDIERFNLEFPTVFRNNIFLFHKNIEQSLKDNDIKKLI